MKKDSMINTGSKNVFRLFIGSSTSTPSQKSSTVVSKVNSDEKRPFSSLSYQRNALKSIGEVNHQFIDSHNSATKNHVENPSLKPSGLSNLLLSEPKFNIDISQIIYMNSEIEERIDGRLRKEALMDLLSLHQAFYSLDSITFAKAICLLDSFISKIKFKPRYIMCVSAACYYMASKFDNSTDALHPTRENLIRLYRCPGTKNDLSLMIEIILNKLSDEFITSVGATNATSVNFLEKFFEILNINNHKDSEGFNWLLISFSRKLEYMLCIPSLTKYRPACQALSLLYGSCLDVKNSLEKVQSLTPLDVLNLAHSCQVDWADIEECYDTFIKESKSDQVNHSGNHFFNNNSQNSNLAHSQFTGSPPIRWNLSKKTRISMHKIASVKPTLTTLIEDESERSKSEDEEGNDFIRSSELQKTDSLEKLSNNIYPINFQTEDDKSKSIINKKLIGNQKEIINPEYTNQPSPGLSSNSSPTEINQQNNLLTSTNDTITNHEVAKITQVVKISQKLTTSSEKITSAATIFTKSSINKKHSIIKANRRQRNQNLFKLHQTKEVQLANDSVYSQPNYPFCEEINDSIWGLLRPLLTA